MPAKAINKINNAACSTAVGAFCKCSRRWTEKSFHFVSLLFLFARRCSFEPVSMGVLVLFKSSTVFSTRVILASSFFRDLHIFSHLFASFRSNLSVYSVWCVVGEAFSVAIKIYEWYTARIMTDRWLTTRDVVVAIFSDDVAGTATWLLRIDEGVERRSINAVPKREGVDDVARRMLEFIRPTSIPLKCAQSKIPQHRSTLSLRLIKSRSSHGNKSTLPSNSGKMKFGVLFAKSIVNRSRAAS